MAERTNVGFYRDYISGVEEKVPLLDGSQRTYINFDNAASTPAFKNVQDAVNDFLPYYSSVHRGTGFKSQLSTHAYELAREEVLRFLGVDQQTHTCIFVKNATEGINLLSHRIRIGAGRNVVLISGMEHHSNDLPWRWASEVYHVALTPDGRLDEDDFDSKLQIFGSRIALVSISGASNVTGWINPIHRLAEKVHAVGAQIAVDCAQLAPHRKIDMLPLDNPAHLDYVAFSAHKMYAPFGSGVLVGRKDTFKEGNPFMRGGGEVDIVTLDNVVWSAPPERDEAGSPNTVGAVALAAAIKQLQEIGMETVARHEAELTAYALRRLKEVPGIIIYGDSDPDNASNRLGVVPINLEGLSHYLVAAVLGYEYGIGVRNGCFCAHPYLLHLMGVSPEEAREVRTHILANDRTQTPGMVRISFGIYNTTEEIDVLVEALQNIRQGKYRGIYQQDRASGDYLPNGYQTNFSAFFKL
jgi:cysteine desulfurase/selenocysteine lyase